MVINAPAGRTNCPDRGSNEWPDADRRTAHRRAPPRIRFVAREPCRQTRDCSKERSATREADVTWMRTQPGVSTSTRRIASSGDDAATSNEADCKTSFSPWSPSPTKSKAVSARGGSGSTTSLDTSITCSTPTAARAPPASRRMTVRFSPLIAGGAFSRARVSGAPSGTSPSRPRANRPRGR